MTLFLVLSGFEGIVLLLDDVGGTRKELVKEFEEAGRVEGINEVGRAGAGLRRGSLDDDDGNLRGAGANGRDDLLARNIVDGGVENDAVDAGEALKGLESLSAAVGRDDVELRGFDDELAGGNGAGMLAVDDEETWPSHGYMVRGEDVGTVMGRGSFVECLNSTTGIGTAAIKKLKKMRGMGTSNIEMVTGSM